MNQNYIMGKSRKGSSSSSSKKSSNSKKPKSRRSNSQNSASNRSNSENSKSHSNGSSNREKSLPKDTQELQFLTKAYQQLLDDLTTNVSLFYTQEIYQSFSKEDEKASTLLEEIAMKNRDIIEQRDRIVNLEVKVRDMEMEAERSKKPNIGPIKFPKAKPEINQKENKWKEFIHTSSKETGLLRDKILALQNENKKLKDKISSLNDLMHESDANFEKQGDEKSELESKLKDSENNKV